MESDRHRLAWASLVQAARTDPIARYGIYASRTLAVRHPEVYLKGGAGADDSEQIEALIQKRLQARADKNWGEADRIRDELHAMGIELEDKGGNTIWRRR